MEILRQAKLYLPLIVVGTVMVAGWADGEATRGSAYEINVIRRQEIRAENGRWFGRASIQELPNGTWMLAYREANGHANNDDGVIHLKFSTDHGKTWTEEDTYTDGSDISAFPAHPPGAGVGDAAGPGEPWLYLAENGTVLLHCWNVDYGDRSRNGGTWQITSTDNGKTWGSWKNVDFVGLDDDRQVFATDDHFRVNGVLYAGAREYKAGRWHNILIKSADAGETWRFHHIRGGYASGGSGPI